MPAKRCSPCVLQARKDDMVDNEESEPRFCSWCGKSDREAPLVAAPNANICEACTRLACAIFGIEIVEKDEPP